MTIEKHLRSVSIAASQRLGSLRKSWRVFDDRSFFGRCFRGFISPVLEYCSAVCCSAADTHLKLLDRTVIGARFLTGGVFECDIAHRRSVAVLCMLYKIICNPMHHLYRALPGPYVPVRVTPGGLVAQRYTYAPPSCRTSQCSSSFIHLSVFLWNYLANPVFDGVGLAGFKSRALSALSLIWSFTIFPFLFLSIDFYCGAGVFGLTGCISLSLSLALPTFFNNYINLLLVTCLP